MCGIVGYIGDKEAYPIVIKGLKRLEYRGYDSAGIALYNGSEINTYKKEGKVSDLENLTEGKDISGNVGIGHTRWATHGPPSDINSHPHTSMSGRVTLIHNGIIENYDSLKKELENRGYTFRSETDTEVLVNLIEDVLINEKVTLSEAVRIALNEVNGAYALIIMDKQNPDELIAARNGSPLVIGIGKNNDFYIASDASPIIEYTENVVYLEDEVIAYLNNKGDMLIKNLANLEQTPYIQKLDLDLDRIEKGNYPHYMLKEIYEQPRVIHDAMRGRMNAEEGWIKMGGLNEFATRITKAKRIIITACGTSYHSGLLGEYLIEELARVPVEVEYASEFRYRNPIITEQDVIIAISQSGETADTLAAMELAKERQALLYGVCNVVGSSIARLSHAGSYTHAGPEIGVASTKAFTTQVIILSLIALQLAQANGSLSSSKMREYLIEMENLPKKITQALESNNAVLEIAKKYMDADNFLYLGRGYNFPVALEGALKLKEISYIHAEGYPAAEMKHGPIALIDEDMPVLFIATNKSSYEKVISNIQEVKARKGKVIAIVNEDDDQIIHMVDDYIKVPNTLEPLSPIVNTIPLQLLAYHIAVLRGCNVDQPRNLAKSVTVE